MYQDLFETFISVETPPFSGNKFTHSNPDWQDGTNEKFNEWALGQFGLKDLDSDEDVEVPVNMQKAKDISFEINKRGHFILPPMSDFRYARDRQRVVRGYIGAVYSELIDFLFLFLFSYIMAGKFTGSKTSSFPFVLAAKEDQNIISPESVPENFTLSDPDHLDIPQINSLYNHWLDRQRKGLPPFVVINPGPLHAHLVKKSSTVKQGKKKEIYVPVRSDDESVKDSDDGNSDAADFGKNGECAEDEQDEDDDRQPEDGEENTKVVKRGPPKKRNVKPTYDRDGRQANALAGPSNQRKTGRKDRVVEEIPIPVKLGPPTTKRKPNTKKVTVLMPSVGSLVSYKI